MPRRQADSQVTDLRRYRKARELQTRRAPPERFLGSRPRAGLILLLVSLALIVLFVLPALR